MKTKTLLTAALAASFGYAVSVNADYIDLFSNPAAPDPDYPHKVELEDANAVGANDYKENTTSYPATILGGYRDLDIEATKAMIAGDNAALIAGDGRLNFRNSAGVETLATVQWDGQDNSRVLDVDGLGGIDLIDQVGCGAGCAAFITEVQFADFNFPYSINVWDMAGNSSTLFANSQFSVGTPPQQDVAGPVAADYLFDWFNFATGIGYVEDGLLFDIVRPGGLVDFADVGALQLQINGGPSAQLAVDLVIGPALKTPTVPEPSLLAMLGIGGLVGGLASRRRRKAQTA